MTTAERGRPIYGKQAAWIFELGRRDFEQGKRCPISPMPQDDCSAVFWRWAGWRIGWASDQWERDAVARKLGVEREWPGIDAILNEETGT
ncbi:hypothetical protein IHQ56_14280 [Methylobacillus flagellatus]|uniref:hypothetical protein n=1 Tax=Methylobacillus flagellatus TaxID=405 RepID=UPI0028541725|nr:hypothetical protein [Methylobacillus flagellatus]MDR5172976.1 hypothetical protein [Methylobacillus flagellatus]